MSKRKPVAKAQPKGAPQSSPTIPTTPSGALWVGLLAAALGFLLYVNTFGHQFCLDDYSAIKENWVVKGGLKNLGIIFSTEYRYGAWNSPGSLYRPLTLAMFALEWQISPDNPFVGHFMNAVFYALSGLALWATWRRILSGYPPVLAAMAVLFFMTHPVHTEVVANIKSRDEIMALLLSTLALYGIWQYFDTRKAGWLAAALLSFFLALFSKESAFMFVFIFPLTIWYFRKQTVQETLGVSALFLAPAAVFLLIRWKVLASQEYDEVYSALDNFIVAAKSESERIASAFMMCGKYLQTLIFPHPLASDLGFPHYKPVGFADWRALAGFLIYGGMGIWALTRIGSKHLLSYAILFYLISFSLFSNVVFLIGTSYGERVLYTPSWGFALALAWFLCKIFKVSDTASILNPGGRGTAIWGTAAVIIALYSIKTIARNPAWYESYNLYAADYAYAPEGAKLNFHLGFETAKRGVDEKTNKVVDREKMENGIAMLTKAIENYPKYTDAYGSRGLAYFRMQQYDKALEDYNLALKYNSLDPTVLSNLGYIYMLRKDLPKAEEVYRKSIEADPRFVDARRNLGAVLAMTKRFPEAIEQWKEALKVDPKNYTILQYIGFAYRDMGDAAQSKEWLDKAAQYAPTK